MRDLRSPSARGSTSSFRPALLAKTSCTWEGPVERTARNLQCEVRRKEKEGYGGGQGGGQPDEVKGAVPLVQLVQPIQHQDHLLLLLLGHLHSAVDPLGEESGHVLVVVRAGQLLSEAEGLLDTAHEADQEAGVGGRGGGAANKVGEDNVL